MQREHASEHLLSSTVCLQDQMVDVARLIVGELNKRLAQKNISLEVSTHACPCLFSSCPLPEMMLFMC